MVSKQILVVDDEKSIRSTLKEILEYEGYIVSEAVDGLSAMQMIETGNYDCILCDIKMPNMDGMDVLKRSNEVSPETPIIIISGHGNIETAVEAVKMGAYDYIAKPPDLNRLLITVRNALEKNVLVAETRSLKKKVSKKYQIIGESPAIKKILTIVDKVAPTDARILITGANGTGKELVAHRIYEQSLRNHQPFIEVNCAAIPSELIESELFGHEKGSFTSAIKQRIGKFEQADGGTLFLDEIGDMSLAAQAKVLRVLQEKKITRVGGEKSIPVNVRIISATNKNLQEEINAGRFREDLYHRLGVILLSVPTLNERKEDIGILIKYFLQLICDEHSMPIKTIDNAAINMLEEYHWSGNIRELRNVVERLVILSEKNITKRDIENYILLKH